MLSFQQCCHAVEAKQSTYRSSPLLWKSTEWQNGVIKRVIKVFFKTEIHLCDNVGTGSLIPQIVSEVSVDGTPPSFCLSQAFIDVEAVTPWRCIVGAGLCVDQSIATLSLSLGLVFIVKLCVELIMGTPEGPGSSFPFSFWYEDKEGQKHKTQSQDSSRHLALLRPELSAPVTRKMLGGCEGGWAPNVRRVSKK